LDGVRERIARAAGRAGRDPSSIRLVAVSKTFPIEAIKAAAAAGQTHFGENKVQEALPKIAATADLGLTWHLVGHLQSNKAKRAGAVFDVVHSVDDRTLVLKLDEAAAAVDRSVDLLVQVDLAGEATKHGVEREALGPLFEAARGCAAARFKGLMVLPPAAADPERARPYFAALRRLRDDLVAQGVDRSLLSELSMGMSHDFEVAIEEGSTIVRVGSAIFGPRGVAGAPIRA
jgi:pyridoxal phosphate enzyme (YggS family)